MKVYVVLENIMGSEPKVFSSLERAKKFCKKQKENYLVFTSEEKENIGGLEVTTEGIEDLFIITEIILDNNADYEWGEY